MSDELLELIFLFGFDYIKSTMHIDIDFTEITDRLFFKVSFLRNLKFIIHKLCKSSNVLFISKCFKLPNYYIKIIGQKGHRTGICNVCDIYCQRLALHLSRVHKLNKYLMKQYKAAFNRQTECYWPDYMHAIKQGTKNVELYSEKQIQSDKELSKEEEMMPKGFVLREKDMKQTKFEKANIFGSEVISDTDWVECAVCKEVISKRNLKIHNRNYHWKKK